MRTFDLPSGTIPDGFGIPFYYYDQFMQFNNFYQEAQVMIDNPSFQTDLNFRIDRLRDFRRAIKDAPMPGTLGALITIVFSKVISRLTFGNTRAPILLETSTKKVNFLCDLE